MITSYVIETIIDHMLKLLSKFPIFLTDYRIFITNKTSVTGSFTLGNSRATSKYISTILPPSSKILVKRVLACLCKLILR